MSNKESLGTVTPDEEAQGEKSEIVSPLTEKGVQEDLLQQPQLMMKLVEKSLLVAENLRDNYFRNTARFISDLRRSIDAANKGKRNISILQTYSVTDATWGELQNELVSFIDGGIGEVELSGQVPILLRVGSYGVRVGERKLTERENFGYYPVIFGDLEGGSKERRDFPDIVRITAELLGGLATLYRNPDLRVLMFHGPLVYLMNAYAGHTPFTEADIDLFLKHYSDDKEQAKQLKEDFLENARLDIYPDLAKGRSDEWASRRLFEPLSWIAFLYRQLISEALKRKPRPIIAGVIERGGSREFCQKVLLERIFRSLREKGNENYFNDMFGLSELTSPTNLMDRLGYTDTLLLPLLLETGEYSEPWKMNKSSGLRSGEIRLPKESGSYTVDFSCLRDSNRFGFPTVKGTYIRTSENTEPIRVEIFSKLGENQIEEAVRRVYLYSRLLPNYGFPVGLDIADKFAHVPNWMTEAYAKMIRHTLGVSLQKGEINDEDMRKVLVQAIYMTPRDWLFRPNVGG